ncbi:MAG: CdvA-like protein [Candidatus Helarchaeota archaeon]|nr:CdvA-like protein [Candidatus Helarchaeota archaeon]
MSQQKECPFCRRLIRMRDKFCPFCGRYVIENVRPQNVYQRGVQRPHPATRAPPATHPPYRAPPVTQPPPGGPPGAQPASSIPQSTPAPQEPEPLSEEVIDQIALRVELEQLDQSMNEIRSKLEELGEMISKMDVTPEIEQKIKNFKGQIKEIKAKRENLNAEKRDLPFDADLTKKKEIQDRLKKLNEAYRSKKVTEAAFKKLRGEYEQSLQEIDDKSRSFKAKINTWIKKLKSDRNKTQEQLELLEARFAAGEMGQHKYEEEKTDYKEKVKRYNNVLKFLTGKL